MYPEYIFRDEEKVNKYFNSVLTFGLAIPRKGDLVFPEVNYQFHDSDFSNGVLMFGFGIRAFINKNK